MGTCNDCAQLCDGTSLPRMCICSDVLVDLELPTRSTQGHGLQGHKDDGQVYARPGLAAQSAKVRGLPHVDRPPPARPTEQGVGRLRGVDRIEDDDGHQCGYEADHRRSKHDGRVDGRVVAELRSEGQSVDQDETW